MPFLNKSQENLPGVTRFGTPTLPLVSPILTNYDKGQKAGGLLHINLTYDRVQQCADIWHSGPAQSSQGSTLKNEASRGLILEGTNKKPSAEAITRWSMNETILPLPFLTGREVITEPNSGYDFKRNTDGTLSETVVKEHSASVPITSDGQPIMGSFLKGLKQQNLITK